MRHSEPLGKGARLRHASRMHIEKAFRFIAHCCRMPLVSDTVAVESPTVSGSEEQSLMGVGGTTVEREHVKF